MNQARSLIFMFVALLFVLPSSVRAEEAEDFPKFTVVIVDSDPKDKGRAFKPLNNALLKRDDMKVTTAEDFLESAKERGVSLRTLRSGKEREKNGEKIAAAMDDAGIEVLIVVDAIKKRRYAQAVVMGPRGKELADIRERISRVKKMSGANKYVFDKVVEVAGPEIAEYREEKAKKAEAERLAAQQAKEAEASAAQDDAELAASMEVEDEADADGSGEFLKLAVSGFFGQRVFAAEAAESSYLIEHTAPLAGASLELGITMARFGSGSVSLEAQGDYAPMSVEFVADGGEPFTVSGHHVAGRSEIVYRHRFGGAFARIGAGADAISSTLDPNSYFTGTRYIAGRATLGGGVGDPSGLLVELHGGVLPVLANNTSGQAYGEAPFALAYTGQARIGFAFSDAIGMQLGYDVRFYSNSYDEPPLASSAVDTTDLIHGGSLGLTFRL